MTEDTKRALEIIGPMARELNIRLDADDYWLYLNGQAIGISCNSTYATIMEFIGYLIFMWAKDRRETIPAELSESIRRYWCSADLVKTFRAAMEEYAKTHGGKGE